MTNSKKIKKTILVSMLLFISINCGGNNNPTKPKPDPIPKIKKIVFMGDSITDFWDDSDADFFKKPYINKGISAEVTQEMIDRFSDDVLKLDPAAVVILGGTNDIGGSKKGTDVEGVKDNLAKMAEMADQHNIKVVLCSITPVYQFPWDRSLKPIPKIKNINKWLKTYANDHGFVYCDYYSALVDLKGGFASNLTVDGVHPNDKGYKVMEPIVKKAINRALK